MTMPSGYIPQRCLHRAKNLDYVRLDGKQHYLGPPDSDEAIAKYDRLISSWLRNGRSLPDSEVGLDRSYLIEDLVAEYFVHFEANHPGSRQPDSLRLAAKPLVRLWGRHPAGQFRPKHLKDFRRYLVGKPLSRTTVNQRITMLKAMFSWAVEEERIHPDVGNAIKAVRNLRGVEEGVKQPRTVTAAPTEAIEAVLELVAPQVAAMIRLQLFTGMRPGEVLIMRAADIDMAQDPWSYRPDTHKNQWRELDRTVFLGARSQEVIRPFLSSRLPMAYLFSPKDADRWHRDQKRANRKSKETPSQARRRERAAVSPKLAIGDRYEVHSYRRAIVRACKQAGVDPWTPHQLRHAAATEIEREFGLDASRAVLGHRSVKTTDIYVHRDHRTAREVAKKHG